MKKILFYLLFLYTQLCISQSYFSKFYWLESTESNGASILLSEDSIIIANTHFNNTTNLNGLEILGLNFSGELLNSRIYEIDLNGIFYSEFGELVRTGDNGFAFFAAVKAPNPNYKTNAYLMKFDPNGNFEWDSDIGYPYSKDQGLAGIQTESGEFVLTGFSGPFDEDNTFFYVLKLDESGDTIWTKRWNAYAERIRGFSVSEDYDGGYLIGGGAYTVDYGEWDLHSLMDGLIYKLNTDGEEVWHYNIGTPDDDCDAYILPYEYEIGKYIVWSCEGRSDTSSSGEIRYVSDDTEAKWHYISMLNETGEEEWRTFFDDKSVKIHQVKELDDGGFILVGSAGIIDSPATISTEEWGWMGRMNAAGELLWGKTYAHYSRDDPFWTFDNWLSDVVVSPDGGFIATGRHFHFREGSATGAQDSQVWILKVDEMGCIEPGCSSDSIYVAVSEIPELYQKDKSFGIYPNPAQHKINLQWPTKALGLKKGEFKVYNASGKMVLIKSIDFSQNSSPDISIEQLNKGLYFCQITINNAVYQQRLIKY